VGRGSPAQRDVWQKEPMRAVLIAKPGDETVLSVGDAPAPPIAAGEVRLAVVTSAVNRADLLQRRGFYPPPPGASSILGLECAGTVAELGPGVTGFSAGQRVMALLPGGGYAEEAVVDAGSVLAVPDGMSFEQAGGFMETYLTAYLNVFVLGDVPEGGAVLVHGGGSGVGTSTVSLCREAGLKSLVTAGGPEKVARCLAQGADVAIDYKAGDFVPKVLEATGGAGVDLVLDSIGAPYFAQNVACLKTEGKLVIIGLMGGTKAEADLSVLMRKRVSVIGSTLRARSTREKAAIVAGFRESFGEALAAGRLTTAVHRVFPLAER
jgi:tumor protein p53-inducible protein 3